MAQKHLRIVLIAIVIAALGAFFYFDLGRFLDFAYIKSQREVFQDFYLQNQALMILLYLLVYIAVTALSLPGAAVLTLFAGFLFGTLTGTIIVSFASSIGATLAFLMARFVLRETVQKKFGDKLKTINDGIEKEGAWYLVTLRLIPVVPFFVINLVMGLTPLPTWKFYVFSQLGMLIGTVIYVNAGTQLADIDSLSGILSPNIILSFVLLGAFPIITKKIVNYIKGRKQNA